MQNPMKQIPPWSRLALLLAVLLLVVGGGAFHNMSRDTLRRNVESDLQTIVLFKAQQIASWFHGHQTNAVILAASMAASDASDGILRGESVTGAPRDSSAKEPCTDLRRLLSVYAGAKHYLDIQLVDAEGHVRCGLAGHRTVLNQSARGLLAEALASGDVRVDDQHSCDANEGPHICFIAPLPRRASRPSMGALVLVTDSRDSLYPLVQSWPRQSRSAETILVRQEGDSILFLSELRYAGNSTLRKKLPMSRNSLPAVQAVSATGMEPALHEGEDYRGVQVLAASMRVPGTPWHVVVKEDREECLSFQNRQSTLILLLIGTLLVLLGAGLVMLQQREKQESFRRLFHAEKELRRSAGRHQIVLQSIGDAVIATDVQGRVELMNPQAERLTGWSSSDATGRSLESVVQIVHEDTRQPVDSVVAQDLREQVATSSSSRKLLISRDGKECPVTDNSAPVPAEDGRLSGAVLVLHDRTGEREALCNLEESEQRFRATFEQAAVGMSHVAPDGRLLRVNQRICEIVGYQRDELMGMTFHEITHPDDLAEDIENARRLLAGEISTYVREKRYLRKDGTPIWVSLNSSLVQGALGHDSYILSVVQDSSRRKRSEAERDRLLSAIEQAVEAVVITDVQGRIVYVNPAFESTTGYARDEVMGKNPRLLKSGKHDAAFYQDMWRVLGAGETYSGRFINRRKDGGLFTEQASISPVRDPSGAVINYVAVKRDVTQENSLEEQLRQAQKMEAVGRLAGGVAHDFNNILQAVLGYSMMLQDMLLPESEEAEFIGEIIRGGERAAALTRQLLTFSRKQTIAPQILDMNDAIVGTLKLLVRLIGEHIELQWQPSFDLQNVRIDPEQLSQVLVNLVMNSRDAIRGTAHDTGRITIETSSAEIDAEFWALQEGARPGQYSVLTVSDTGVGMDDATRVLIFEPFFTTKELGQGTGLGLATVYGIVKQNAGFITVQSTPGQGTTISIHLPVVKASEQADGSSDPPAEIRTGQETILLVEDELPLLRFAEQLLRSLGYTVLAAGSPRQALDLVGRAGGIDLLLTDVVMPGMSGRDLHNILVGQRAGLKCLYISGYDAEIIAHRGILDEGLQFLAKPFTRVELATKLREILDADV